MYLDAQPCLYYHGLWWHEMHISAGSPAPVLPPAPHDGVTEILDIPLWYARSSPVTSWRYYMLCYVVARADHALGPDLKSKA